ncbi:hypothetical protein ACOZ38_29625 [Sphaerisporangium viridialbum]|uniref:hypothetical protein n=1 Tax=Sphaerisporangium viridialbum TaxID=46189 RepID=UPI003C73D049
MTTPPAPAEVFTTRHADLKDLVTLLRDQQGRKVDIVTPSQHSAPKLGGTERR